MCEAGSMNMTGILDGEENGNSRYPSGMTTRTAKTTATANATAKQLQWQSRILRDDNKNC
jgi:hypothetical protein